MRSAIDCFYGHFFTVHYENDTSVVRCCVNVTDGFWNKIGEFQNKHIGAFTSLVKDTRHVNRLPHCYCQSRLIGSDAVPVRDQKSSLNTRRTSTAQCSAIVRACSGYAQKP